MTFIEGKSVAEAFEELKFAYESGVNFFDNSESYGETSQGWVRGGVSEVIMGQAVQLGIKQKLWARMDLVISTKLMWGGRGTLDTPNSVGLSRKHLVEGMHASLERMQLDYVDLVFCHRPDSRTPIWETCRAMNFLIDQGLAFYWGTSEWSEAQLAEAMHVCDKHNLIPPLFEQCEYSVSIASRLCLSSLSSIVRCLPSFVSRLVSLSICLHQSGLTVYLAGCARSDARSPHHRVGANALLP
jgi:aryl-alcohol dehydrogenase-like predicted oxidoreductase